ncbi:PEP-CTERM sorting domain-containing protein [Aestuariibacter sp. AA17]|uniref:PEP-CTERM sorting domain-containing protein n=1 Tax=Fluctibacter corallii TaxID=2984329 RepID=A0ABT3ABF7_9ALTE|nr:PEP-CTERM sorting domain-containing protein [Aestuariibacter sp. AA17]MCV2886017.1 PEP-CTERM sorting domain-containing protein [Aestuariibacter sp. AA17]
MKLTRSVCALALLGTASFANASMINVGGVTWDPSYQRPASPPFISDETDLIQKVQFSQWFVDAADAGTTDTSKVISPDAVTAGDELQAVGSMTYFNGLTDPEVFPGPIGFCLGCEVTFRSTGLLADGLGGFTTAVGGAFLEFFVETGADVDQMYSGTGTPWLTLAVDEVTFSARDSTAGNEYRGGNIQLALSAVGGPAAQYMDTNTISNSNGGFSDIFYNADAIFNMQNGNYFASGTADLVGDTIPEPSALALFMLGMLALLAQYSPSRLKRR